jgi:VanZ family protein
MALIFVLSSQTRLPTPPQPLAARLVEVAGHMLAFGVLQLLVLHSMELSWPGRTVWGWALLLTLVYALSDEYHQSFVPGRHATPLDAVADAAGMLLALGSLAWSRARRGDSR